MDAHNIISRMERTIEVLPPLVAGLPADDAVHRPDDKTWSILEIVCHLADEEAEDFRPRLKRTLTQAEPAWDPIDPEGWASAHNYRDADLAEQLDRFTTERRRSMEWLRTLRGPDWSRAYQHPRWGPIHAGDLLAAWAAHDALHLRQIAKRLYELAARDAEGFTTIYAGEWGP